MVYTAHDETDLRDRAAALGARGYVVKDVAGTEAVLAAVASSLDR